MQVPLLDLKKQYQPLRERIRAKMDEVADSQYFILGPEVEGLEREVCAFTGAGHAIGVSSGTDAELAILMALGVGPGDAVVTTPYTFFATAGCVGRLGARILFVDIEPETYNISPEKLRACLEAHRGERIKAIIPVHLFGQSCRMDEILALAAAHGAPVIEDGAQALGAEYPGPHGAAKCGAMGEFGFYSFFPSKNLGAFGDGGMIVCRDAAMAAKIRSLRNHGMEQRYYHHMVGGNFRLDAMQAAILRIKLPHLDEWSAMRRTNAARYRKLFCEAGLGKIVLPAEAYAGAGAANHHIYNQFVIRAPRRDELLAHLAAKGIGHAVYYPVPLHRQDCFAHLGYREGDFPEAEKAARETVALPIYPELTAEQQSAVVGAIADFFG
ncbi:MAG TPA: DegT/DnrJ/EryC1/StrS family aminotransferase [Chthoniobacteraceae bacterium]|jgi:dTDP-4-amino-4,6-dideoxygalactose transaminase|nr:DegT/DnrJ/EryC1/StrS family aminotransferase [Chthoniobacteraceae bacterium]